jgi:hypothetical protein
LAIPHNQNRNGEVYFTVTATNSQAQRDALTLAAARRSLEPLRHATRSGQGDAAIRDFVEASKKSTASSEQNAMDDVDEGGDTGVSVSIYAEITIQSAHTVFFLGRWLALQHHFNPASAAH